MWLELNKLAALEKHHGTCQMVIDLQGGQVADLNTLYGELFQNITQA